VSGVPKALQINPRDNVAVLLNEVRAGEEVTVKTENEVIRLNAQDNIAFGHKIALTSLKAQEPVIKYGEEIGKAQTEVSAGHWIHVHNVDCRRGREV